MRNEVKIMALVLAIVIVGAIVGARYYRGTVQNTPKPAAPNSALVRDDSHSIGPADAKITLVEFYDPECESCAAFSPIVKKIMKDHDGKVRLVVRYMPLHPNSIAAANFSEAAAEQGKFWEAREMLFQKQSEWGERHGAPSTAPKPDIPKLFESYARELGLDVAKVSKAIRENTFAARIERDKKDGQSIGVRKTPQFFVNGRELVTFGESSLRSLIADELKK